MRRFLLLLSFLLFVYMGWTVMEKEVDNSEFKEILESVKEEVGELKDDPAVMATIQEMMDGIKEFTVGLRLQSDKQQHNKQPEVEKPELTIPKEQTFSINNVEIGNQKEQVEQELGKAHRETMNEYGTMWLTYHHNYQHFMMISFDDAGAVAGLYTNQDLIASTNGIKRGSTKEFVREKLGEPSPTIRKGYIQYKFEENADFDLFQLDDSYITIFYDKHDNHTVTAIQIISEELESQKKTVFAKGNQDLKEGYEFQLFDLTNATRINHGLGILEWDDVVKETARKHSQDMAVNAYFSHTNLEGQSPFDRMLEDDITFSVAGENLAFGQLNSIFAHEGLMNSLGHRENILQKDFKQLGVGVAFNDNSQPYFTEKFYTR